MPLLRGRSGSYLAWSFIGVLVAGLVLAVVALFSAAGGYPWPDKAWVRADGIPHMVPTDGREVWLWNDESIDVDPRVLCTATTSDGTNLAVGRLHSDVRRAGKLGDARPVAVIHTDAESVLVTCDPPTGVSLHLVPVQPRPRLLAFAGWPPLLAPGLGLSALAAAGLGTLALARSRPRQDLGSVSPS